MLKENQQQRFWRSLQGARIKAKTEVRRRAMLSVGASLVPIPGLDAAVDVGALVSMFNAINRAFCLTPEQVASLNTQERLAILKAILSVKAPFAGKTVTHAMVLTLIKQLGAKWIAGKAARWIPLVGQGATAVLSYGVFWWLGEEHIKECIAVRYRAQTLLWIENDRPPKE